MKTKIALYFISSIIFAGIARADNLPAMIPVENYNLGLEFADITYREPSLGVRESGPVFGLYGAYDYRLDMPILDVWHLDGHVDYSNVDYKGSGKINNISDWMGEPRLWAGHDFNLMPQLKVTPYFGVGYRFLFDHLKNKVSSIGALGYDRFSQYLYLPVGFELSTEAVPGWKFGFTTEYDIFIHGWQKSYLSNIQGLPDITNDQKSGYGIRGSFDIIKKGDRFNYVVSPYVRYWNVKKSNTVTATGSLFQVTGYEPANHSIEAGVRLGVEF